MKNPLALRFFIYLMNSVRPLISEKPQITMKYPFPEPSQPVLWLPQHQAWDDIVTLCYAWPKAGSPSLKAIARSNYFPPFPLLSRITEKVMEKSGVFYLIHRSDGALKDESERKRCNKKAIENLVEDSFKGFHGVILPEGTSKNNGRIYPLKSGCYFLAKSGVPCVAVGNTYDFMSGSKGLFGRRKLVFFNFGPVFKYAPLERKPEESDEDYLGRDRLEFLDRVRSYYIDLNTITTSQLGSLFFLESYKEGKPLVFSRLRERILEHVDRFKNKDVALDEGLLDEKVKEIRISNFYDSLFSNNLIKERTYSADINIDRMRSDIANRRSKWKENPVLHSANKIIEVAEERPHIRRNLAYSIEDLVF